MVCAKSRILVSLDFARAMLAKPISTWFAVTATDAISGSVSWGLFCAVAGRDELRKYTKIPTLIFLIVVCKFIIVDFKNFSTPD
jgi:hypothetical protein